MKHQGKSGSGAKRKVVPLVSTAMGRRIADLEKAKLALEGQRTMLVRAIGALVIELSKARGDEHAEPAVLIPFADMNVSRDIGFAVDKESERPGLVVAVSNPIRPAAPIDSAAEVEAMVDTAAPPEAG